MKKIGIIGAGTMGIGIAHCFAQHKFEICLFDVSQDNLSSAIVKISNNLDRMIKKSIISKNEKMKY